MHRPSPATRARPRTGRSIAVWLTRLALYGTLATIGAFCGMVTAAFPELDKLESSAELRRTEGYVVARDGKHVLRRLRGQTSRRYAKLGEVPLVLQDAVIAAEDRRFRTHVGVDPRAIARAAWADLRQGSIEQGGSTITQQLVKNAYLGSEQTLGRKTREAMIAVALETQWSKERILTAYLNVAYFGRGSYGIRDGAQTWFGRAPNRLNIAQSAFLAGIVRGPELYDPIRHPMAARDRRENVLTAMRDANSITQTQFKRALQVPLPTRRQLSIHASKQDELAPHFVDDVVSQLIERYGVATTLGGGLRVRTTLDAPMQRAANDAVDAIAGTGLSAALAAIDPASGEVRAMSIGGEAADAAFNVASAGRRQPGSAFKPIVLAAAYATGYTPSSQFLSAPYRGVHDGTPFTIENYSPSYSGSTPLDVATWHSDNTVYARLMERVGEAQVIDLAHRAGIDSRMVESPVTALGALTDGVTPLELASAYAIFAQRGIRAGTAGGEPHVIRRVSAPKNAAFRAQVSRKRILPTAVADLVTHTLEGVMVRGTGTRAAIGRPAAGKTGTTDDHSDAWFVGYTPTLVAAVWVGHPEGRIPMRSEYGGAPVAGGTYPAQIWARFMNAALASTPKKAFASSRIEFVTRRIDPRNRLLADAWCSGAVVERFVKGTEPTRQSSDCPSLRRELPNVVGMPAAAAKRLLKKMGFQFEVREMIGPPGSSGSVLVQIPPAGTEVERTMHVRLFVVSRTPRDG